MTFSNPIAQLVCGDFDKRHGLLRQSGERVGREEGDPKP